MIVQFHHALFVQAHPESVEFPRVAVTFQLVRVDKLGSYDQDQQVGGVLSILLTCILQLPVFQDMSFTYAVYSQIAVTIFV